MRCDLLAGVLCWWFEGDSKGCGDDLKETRVVLRAGDDVICLQCLALAVDGVVIDERRKRGR